MRMTVGPLPPAVYWRRRGAVGAALLAVLLGFTTCTAGGSDAASDSAEKAAETPSADPSPAPATPVPSPSAIAQAAPGGACTDAQLSLTAVPVSESFRSGTMPKLRLVIQNVGSTPCRRDVGADEQELRVMTGTQRVWSSDDCQPLKGRSLRTLVAGEKRTYTLTWSGKHSVPGCAQVRTRVEPGRYEVQARLGSLLSERVAFTIV